MNEIRSSPTFHGDPPAAATDQGLADRRELAFVAVERTRMPMVVTDPRQPDNPIVLANSAFLQLTGYPAEEVLGRNCRFLQGPETSPEAIDQIRAAVAREEEANVELINYRKDATSFWNRLHLSPIHDDGGELIYFFASQLDVTDYRRARALETAEHRLLREVDHRAMNALAVVEAIVRLTKTEDAKHYALSVQQRVQALARAHTLLAEHGWRGAPLEAMLRDQAAAYRVERLSLDGPPTRIAAEAAQPFALVLHELMANARQHGALSSRAGSLNVRWREPQPGQGLALTWEEFGGSRPAPEGAAGFGFTMISAIIQRQLRGDWRREWRPDGLRVNLDLPAWRRRNPAARAAAPVRPSKGTHPPLT